LIHRDLSEEASGIFHAFITPFLHPLRTILFIYGFYDDSFPDNVKIGDKCPLRVKKGSKLIVPSTSFKL